MVERKTKNFGKLSLRPDKKKIYALSIILFFIIFGAGSIAFSTFGIDSVWGADIQFDKIKFGSNTIASPEELPDFSFNVGSRTITMNYDGLPQDEFDWDNAPIYWTTRTITYADAGMKPKVNYDLGRFIYFDRMNEEVATAIEDIKINYEEETADIHFYFGFSIGFSTAATVAHNGQGWRTYVPSPYCNYAYYTESLAETGTVELTSEVALRFEAIIAGDYEYKGVINSVTVLKEYGYYVTRPADYSGSYDIDIMNSDYDWNSEVYYAPGKAESLGEPKVLYGQIDSTTADMAIITAGAKLTPGVDPRVEGGLNAVPKEGLSGWLTVSALDVYNVGFIYDLIIDVSINDIPLVDPGADYLAGRIGMVFSQKAPPVVPYSDLLIVLVIVVGFVIGHNLFSRRR